MERVISRGVVARTKSAIPSTTACLFAAFAARPNDIEVKGDPEEDEVKTKKEAEAQAARKSRQDRLAAGFGRGHEAYTFDRDDRRDAKGPMPRAMSSNLTKFSEKHRENIGDVGSGKTFLAGCIANALIEKGRVRTHDRFTLTDF